MALLLSVNVFGQGDLTATALCCMISDKYLACPSEVITLNYDNHFPPNPTWPAGCTDTLGTGFISLGGAQALSAWIDWGDGTTTPLAITPNPVTSPPTLSTSQQIVFPHNTMAVEHVYSTPGTYLPAVYYSDVDSVVHLEEGLAVPGCTASSGIVITNDVIQGISNLLVGTCSQGNSVSFDLDHLTTVTSISVFWGDGSSSNASNSGGSTTPFSHTYSSSGTYIITVKAYAENCFSTQSFEVELEQLEADFYWESFCQGNQVDFQYVNSCFDPAVHDLEWIFGDGTSSGPTNQNYIAHNYSLQGNSYSVTLNVLDQNGNVLASHTEVVTTQSIPEPQVSGLIENLCSGNVLTFSVDNWSSFPQGSLITLLNGNGIVAPGSFADLGNGSFTAGFTGSGAIEIKVSHNGCWESAFVDIYDCCGEVTPYHTPPHLDDYNIDFHVSLLLYLTNTSASQAIAAGAIPSNGQLANRWIMINGAFIMDHDISFTNCAVVLGPDARIELVSSGTDRYLFADSTAFFGCADEKVLWDGIYADNPNEHIELNNCHVLESMNGLVSERNGGIKIADARLFANNQSLQILDYNPSNSSTFPSHEIAFPPSNNQHSVRIQNVKFNGAALTWYYNTGFNGNPSSLKPPLAGQTRPRNGARVSFAANVVLGSDQGQNSYANSRYGIEAYDAALKVVNSTFEDHWGSGGWLIKGEPRAAGIFIKVSPNFSTSTGGGTAQYSWSPRLTVLPDQNGNNCVFSDSRAGIYGFNLSINVQGNQFGNCMDAIWLKQPKGMSRIKTNIIGGGSGSVLTSGIRVRNPIPSYKKVAIEGNQINRCKNGIVATNILGPSSGTYDWLVIKDNTVQFTDPGYTGFFTGVYVEGSDASLITLNNITGPTAPTTNPTWRGVTITESEGAIVADNYLKEVSQGIRAAGYLIGTQFYCNRFDDCYNGFYFVYGSNPAAATFISDQVLNSTGNGVSADNEWVSELNLGTGGGNYRLNGGINTTGVNWYFQGAGGADLQGFNPMIYLQHTTFNLVNALNEHPNTPPSNICAIFSILEYLYEIREDLIYYDTLAAEFQYKADRYAYRILEEEPERRDEATSEELAYENYFQSLESRNIDEFYTAEKLVDQGQYGAALAIIQGINSENWIETNRKAAYEAYLTEYLRPMDFEPATFTSLNTMSYETPYTTGDGVFYARVMLGLLTTELPVPYSDRVNDLDVEEDSWGVVYPNPVGDETYFVPKTGVDRSLSVVVTDATGRLVWQANFEAGADFLRIPGQSWSSGVYLMTITGGAKTQVERLVKE